MHNPIPPPLPPWLIPSNPTPTPITQITQLPSLKRQSTRQGQRWHYDKNHPCTRLNLPGTKNSGTPSRPLYQTAGFTLPTTHPPLSLFSALPPPTQNAHPENLTSTIDASSATITNANKGYDSKTPRVHLNSSPVHEKLKRHIPGQLIGQLYFCAGNYIRYIHPFSFLHSSFLL